MDHPLVAEMRRRTREADGDEASEYLARISAGQRNELDAALAKTLSSWLDKH